jgi:hypothetical protein
LVDNSIQDQSGNTRLAKLDRLAMFAVLSFVAAVILLLLINRTPNGSDFVAYWSAGQVLWEGRAPEVYDFEALRALQAPWRHDLPFIYPPPYLLVIAPFTFGSYQAGFIAWTIVSMALYFLVVRKLFPRAPWLATLFPPVLVCITSGQNGLITASLFLTAMMVLDRRPVIAGALIGALVIKPQLAVLIPIALIAGGRWRAFMSAAISSLGLLIMTELVLPGTLVAFLEGAQHNLSAPNEVAVRMRHSVHSAVLVLEAEPVVAMAAQAVSSITMAIVVWWTWRRDLDTMTKAAVLMAATPLATWYILDYDLVFLALPIALVARQRPRLATGLSLVPLFSRDLSVATGIGVGPLMFAILLYALLRPPVARSLDHKDAEAKVSAQS